MTIKFDKEKFLNDIHTLPHWVKNGDDLLNFCKHIQYRLFQRMAELAWFKQNCSISNQQLEELNVLSNSFDECYTNDTSKFPSFDEIFKAIADRKDCRKSDLSLS